MKILNLKLLPLLMISVLCLFTLASCGDDVDTNEELELLGFTALPSSALTSYSGYLGFENTSGDEVEEISGTATIRKTGDTYAIDFSNNVPSITSRKFILDKDDNDYISVDTENPEDGIIIKGTKLVIQLTVKGNDWEFVGDR